MTNRESLINAATMIESVARKLDTDTRTCEHCNMKRYAHFSEFQLSVELHALSKKLLRYTSNPLLKIFMQKGELCPQHQDSPVWDGCTEGFVGCELEKENDNA